jgi:membrane fusion protein, multidrug efflux system
MKKRIGLWLALGIFAGLIFWKLKENKAKIGSNAQLSQVTRAFVPVEVTTPSYEPLGSKLSADGIFMPSKEMFVISETAGRVVEVYKNRGEEVKEGELLAKIDDEILRLQLATVEANIGKGQRDKERLTNLIEGEAIPKSKIEEVELALLTAQTQKKTLEKQIANTSMRAPMSGILTFRLLEKGGVIAPGIQVGQITNIDKLLLFVKVTERDILDIRKGQRVQIVPDVYPNKPFPAIVTNLGVKADNAFNYDVEIEVTNNSAFPLKAGMHAKAQFDFSSGRKGLVIDRRAIVGSVQDARVFVVRDSVVLLKSVGLGLSEGDRIEITSGIVAGEKVVLNGQINLTDGAKVQIIEN